MAGPRFTEANMTTLQATIEGIEFTLADEDAVGTLTVLFDDRRIWSFHAAHTSVTQDRTGAQTRFRAWPRPLVPYLDGRVTVALTRPGQPEALASTSTRFGSGEQPLRFVDDHDRPLVINKWGGLGRVIDDFADGARTRLLDHTDRVRAVLEALGLAVYVTGGTLLGPVRDGQLMGNDDDTDLGYLSRYSHPTDVARENFRVGRALRRAGFEVQRLSAGHMQVHFQHGGCDEHYVDVFTSWLMQGWWYQLFCIRARLTRDDLVPLGTVSVEDRREPAPRRPERMLEAIYGPDWRVPDPAFRFRIPKETARRLGGWIGDLHMHRKYWQDRFHYEGHDAPPDPGGASSPFARWVAERIEPATPLVELGCGDGQDAVWFAGAGHRVHAVDYVRPAIAAACAVARTHGLAATFTVLNLYDLRTTVRFGALLAAQRQPYRVYARGLVSALTDPGRANLIRLLSMILRDGGRGYLDFVAPGGAPDEAPAGKRRVRRIRPERLEAELDRAGLRIVERDADDATGPPSASAEEDVRRIVVAWGR